MRNGEKMCLKHNYKVESGIIYCTSCGKHKHKYIKVKEIKVYEDDYSKQPYRFEWMYECTVCGKVKMEKL